MMCSGKTICLETLIMREDVPPPSTNSNQLKLNLQVFKIIFINTENQIANIFTKLLNQEKFSNFKRELRMCNFESSS